MINFIKNKDIRRILSNFFSLGSIHLTNLILPLISMPYLIHVLGLNSYGILTFSQATIGMLSEFADFGFQYSATRVIAIHKSDTKKINTIFSSVIISKLIFLIIALFILLILTHIMSSFENNKYIIYITFLMAIGNAIFPFWFFLGIEKTKYISYLNILSKIIFTGGLFIFVTKSDDINIAAYLFSGGYLVSGMIAFFIAIYKFKIRLVLPSIIDVTNTIKDSASFFLARISATIYGASDPILLGIVLGSEAVGIYSVAEKLYFAVIRCYQAVANAVYPFMSSKKNILLFKKIFYIIIMLHIIGIAILWSLSSWIVPFFTRQSVLEVITIFKILLIGSIFTVSSIMLTYPFIAAMGYPKKANLASLVGLVIHLLLLMLIFSINMVEPTIMAIVLSITELGVMITLIAVINRLKLWK